MTVKENITLYKCDFCKKELKRRHAMETHEERCSGNPVNYRPCLGCQHLERKEIQYYAGVDDDYSGEPVYRKGKAFFCAKKNKLLLHPKTEYFNWRFNIKYVTFNGEHEVEQDDMPKQCEIFDSESDDFKVEIDAYNKTFTNPFNP